MKPFPRTYTLLLLPYLIGSLLLVLIPGVLTFALAFTAYDGLALPRWVGWQTFRDVWIDPVFPVAAGNTLIFVGLSLPLRVLLALVLALVLERRRRGVRLYRAAVYTPMVIPDVASALIWLWILNPLYGPLNLVLRAVGIAAPAWLVQPETALFALIGVGLFQIGESFVVLLVGLHNIPASYYEQARLDGGGAWQCFRSITLPLLLPWLLLVAVRDLILLTQQSFVPAYLMTSGGPYYATTTLPLLIYNEAFDRLRFGHGAAMLLLQTLLIGMLVLAGVWLARQIVRQA